MPWLIIEVMDDTACRAVESRAIKACTRHLMRMNVPKFSGEQLRTLERSIEDYCEPAENYRFKNVFLDIYRQYDKEFA